MARTNGNGSNGHAPPAPETAQSLALALAGLRGTLAGLQAAIDALTAERADLEARLPEIKAAVHVAGDKSRADELRVVNARLQVIVDSLDGYKYQLGTLTAEAEGAEAKLSLAARLERLTRAEAAYAEFGLERDRRLSRAAAHWSDCQTEKEAAYAAQRERIAQGKIIAECLNEMGGVGTEGHDRPPRESLYDVDTRLEKMTGRVMA